MFTGNTSRLQTLKESKLNNTSPLKYTRRQLELLEQTHYLSLGEKLDLILISLGEKLTTEIYQCIEYAFDPNANLEFPQENSLESVEILLKSLPFPYYMDSCRKKDKKTQKPKLLHWFQVSLNEKVSYYMKTYQQELTEIEQGVLYGFPLSAIRAFSEFIPMQKPLYETPAEYFLSGVRSKQFYKEEQEYYLSQWEKIRSVSPQLIEQAEAKFAEQKQKKRR